MKISRLLQSMALAMLLSARFAAAQSDKDQALIAAARNGDLAAASRLLQQGASADAALPAAGAALARGADALPGGDEPATATARTRAETALTAAASSGSVEIARLLIASGAAVERAGSLGPPLAVAVLRGDARMAELLLRAGADPNVRDGAGATPLYRAVLAGDAPLARRLLQSGANADMRSAAVGRAHGVASSGMPLIEAAKQGSLELARPLLESGARPDARDSEGKSPLFWAIVEGTEEVALLLLEWHANAHERIGTYDLIHFAKAMHRNQVAEKLASAPR